MKDIEEVEDKLAERKAMLRTLKDKQEDAISRRERLGERAKKLKESTEKVKMIEDAVDFDDEWDTLLRIQEVQLEAVHQHDLAQSFQEKHDKLKKDYDKLEKELEHLLDDKCPYCKQTFEDGKSKIDEINTKLNDLVAQMEKAEDDRDIAQAKESQLDEDVDNYKQQSLFKGDSNEYDAVHDNYKKHKAIVDAGADDADDIEGLDGLISELGDGIEGVMGEIKELEDEEFVSRAARLYDSIALLEKDAARLESARESLEELEQATNPHIEVLEELEAMEFKENRSDELNELEETLRHQDFLLKLLTKKDSFLRKKFLDKQLPKLNDGLMRYLGVLGLPHRVEFLPDMSAQISQFGTPLDFGSLSSGQRARVNLALAFAFRDVLQKRYGKISFCMLDECLDTGLGNVGVQLAAKMIKDIANEDDMSMFVISHRDEIASMFPKKMTVELKNGFSTILED